MSMRIEMFDDGIQMAEDGLMQCMQAFREAGGDIVEGRIALIIRRLQQNVSELHERVETYGLVDGDEDAV